MLFDDVLKFKVSTKRKNKKRVKSKELAAYYKLRSTYFAVLRGDFDPENMTHVIYKQQLIKRGFIDADHNILKDIVELPKPTERKQDGQCTK